jgi:hypothetical protein
MLSVVTVAPAPRFTVPPVGTVRVAIVPLALLTLRVPALTVVGRERPHAR